MAEPQRKAHVVVVVPVLARAALPAPSLLRWLTRAALRRGLPAALDLVLVLRLIGRQAPTDGIAALRLWGQTGERPGVWVAAADPAFLEARLDRVHMRALPPSELPPAELRRLYDDLQQALCAGGPTALAGIGTVGYLRGEDGFPTAALPPAAIDGQRIDEFLPAADPASLYLSLSGEIQTSLHQHPLNAAREARGQRPINTLWIWGGGYAPREVQVTLPPLFSDDPLLHGYWLSCRGRAVAWPGSFDDCLQGAADGFIATIPDDAGDDVVSTRLAELHALLRNASIGRLTLVLRNGIVAELRRGDRFRFWRRNDDLLFGAADDRRR
jgi:hypothetical protein